MAYTAPITRQMRILSIMNIVIYNPSTDSEAPGLLTYSPSIMTHARVTVFFQYFTQHLSQQRSRYIFAGLLKKVLKSNTKHTGDLVLPRETDRLRQWNRMMRSDVFTLIITGCT